MTPGPLRLRRERGSKVVYRIITDKVVILSRATLRDNDLINK